VHSQVKECAYKGNRCHFALKNRAIEASSSHGLEPLGIVIFSVAVSSMTPVLVFLGLSSGHRKQALVYLEPARMLMAVAVALLVLSVHHVQRLTHDCRWWGDFHHGNSKVCHKSFNLFIASAGLLGFCQIFSIALITRSAERERWQLAKDLMEMDPFIDDLDLSSLSTGKDGDAGEEGQLKQSSQFSAYKGYGA